MQALWMVVSALLFAFYAACVKFASLEGIGSFEVLFYRSFFGLILICLLLKHRKITIRTKHPIAHSVRAGIGTVACIAGIYAISKLNIGLAMTLNYTSPLFIGCFTIGAALRAKRKVNWRLISTLVVGFIGVVVLLSPTIAPHEYAYAGIGLSAGFCTAIAVSYVKRLANYHEPELRILFYFVLIGAIAGLIGTLAQTGFTLPTWNAALFILGFSVFANAAQICLTRAFSRGNVVLSGALQYTVILFSTLLGEIIFDEPATPSVILGMVMIVCSGIAASYFTRQEILKNQQPRPSP